MTTIRDLLAVLDAHLAEFELSPIASVHVTAAVSAPQVTVQLSCRAPSTIAASLLAWADTLTAITAEVWRVPQGDSVHLSVTGLLPGGVAVQIYGAMPVIDCRPATDLAPNATRTLPLGILRCLTTPGQALEEVPSS